MKSQVIKKQFYVRTICDTDGSFFFSKAGQFSPCRGRTHTLPDSQGI